MSLYATAPVKEPQAKPVKLLLVDDRPANLTALEAVLETLGQEIETANSGKDAITRVSQEEFAVIVLDVMMPEMDGFETAIRIRQVERSRSTPIIFVTAYRDLEEQLLRGYGAGAVDFLYKPIDPDVLRFKVSVFIALQRQRGLLKEYSNQLSDGEASGRADRRSSDRQ